MQTEERFDLIDYINIIYLKNQLLTLSSPEILEKYKEKEMYGLFLDTVNIMNYLDHGFLLISRDSAQKIETVIQNNRFRYQDSSYHAVCNDIILFLNTLKGYSDLSKNSIKQQYLLSHEETRKMQFATTDAFLEAISYDACCYHQLSQHDLENVNEVLFLSSVNYFVDTIPELFAQDDVENLVNNKLAQVSQKKGFRNRTLREFATVTSENFQKIKTLK